MQARVGLDGWQETGRQNGTTDSLHRSLVRPQNLYTTTHYLKTFTPPLLFSKAFTTPINISLSFGRTAAKLQAATAPRPAQPPGAELWPRGKKGVQRHGREDERAGLHWARGSIVHGAHRHLRDWR